MGEPCALVALQPEQLVSMEPMPGVTKKAEFADFAVTNPLPQPAASSSAGAKSSENLRRDRRGTVTSSV
jgi:hypothetical protein